MEDKFKNKIIDDIYKTGFVTELQISSLLLKKGWFIQQNKSYEDKDLHKSREIDIVSYKSFQDENISIGIHLVIEAKKSPAKPWVIFVSPVDIISSLLWCVLSSLYNPSGEILTNAELKKYYFRNGNNMVGRAFHEAFKTNQDTSKIYEAILTACKASISQLEGTPTEFIKSLHPRGGYHLNLILPVIIVDGVLCEASLNTNGDIELQSKNYIPVEINYSSPAYGEKKYYPDIVQLEGLDNYLDGITSWGNSVLSIMQEKLKKKIVT